MRVLLVLADSLSPDYLGCYNSVRRTPVIDSLAAEGARFDLTLSSAPWTVPAISAMLTGQWSHRMGLVKWEQPWDRRIPTLFDDFMEAGCERASFVFDPGHLFVNCPEASVVCSSQDVERMLAWFRERRGKDWFAFVHYWWTHVPYLDRRLSLPEWKMLCSQMVGLLREPDEVRRGENREKLKGLYALAVERFSERWLPRLLESAQADVVMITADHGESWGERLPRGIYPKDVFDLHGNNLYEESIRIPWIIHAPGKVRPGTVQGLARSVDLAPTLLELVGLRRPAPFPCGESLVRCLSDGRIPGPRLAFFSRNRDFVDSETLPRDPNGVFVEFGCSDGELKVVRNLESGETRAYDLCRDPAEKEGRGELTGGAAARVRQMRIELDAEIELARVAPHRREDFVGMRQRLKELGYLS